VKRNALQVLVALAVVATVGLTVAGCKDGNDDNGGGTTDNSMKVSITGLDYSLASRQWYLVFYTADNSDTPAASSSHLIVPHPGGTVTFTMIGGFNTAGTYNINMMKYMDKSLVASVNGKVLTAGANAIPWSEFKRP